MRTARANRHGDCRPLWLVYAMMRAAENERRTPPPKNLLWAAVWWRLQGLASANQAQCNQYAVNLTRRARCTA